MRRELELNAGDNHINKSPHPAFERGYLLLEVAILGVLVIAIALSISIYAKADMLRVGDAARSTAIFLAKAQFAEMEEMAHSQNLQPLHYNYLGDNKDLRQNGFIFQVESDVTYNNDNRDLFEAKVEVSWNGENLKERTGRVTLYRIIR